MKPDPNKKRRAPLPRRAILWIVLTTMAYLLHTVCGQVLVGHDIFSAVIGGKTPETVVAAVFLIPARLYLYLLAPAWAFYITVRTIIEQRAASRRRSVVE